MVRPTTYYVITSETMKAAAAAMIEAGASFSIEPLPYDCWEVTFKAEETPLRIMRAFASTRAQYTSFLMAMSAHDKSADDDEE